MDVAQPQELSVAQLVHEELTDSLNQPQKEAVTAAPEGALVILAGPGSGVLRLEGDPSVTILPPNRQDACSLLPSGLPDQVLWHHASQRRPGHVHQQGYLGEKKFSFV